jgi:cell division protein FtsB
MRALKYLIALWTAIVVYCVFSLLNGAMGISAYTQLLSEREKQWDNMKSLRILNEELENTKNSLLYDRDTITVYARQLGYGREEERFIRIVGLGGIKNPHAEAGQVFQAGAPDFLPDRIVKIIALFAGVTVFILFFVFELIRREKFDF